MRTDTTLVGALIYEDNSEGYITKLISEGGTLFSTASRFAIGCMLTDGQTGTVYFNTGTVAVPSWETSLNDDIENSSFSSPKLGVVQETVAVADFDDSGANTIGFIDFTATIPAGAIVTQSTISALTGFAGDTSATIQIGDGSTADRYSTGTPDVFTTAAFISAGAVSGTAYNLTAVTPRVTVTGNADFTSIVTDGSGEVTITIFYYTV